jgi:16S rRNA (cytidine1402-2'-O)-methyltransferase
MLFLISTPIGHLSDVSERAIKTLNDADLILCEDTRRSSIFLNHYQIKKPLQSYHLFNEKKELLSIVESLKAGKNIALISDAGTPCINDPGLILVQTCIAESVPFTLIPGPCSPIMALILSGFDSSLFQFVGFIPKKDSLFFKKILSYPGTTISFESPERVRETLKSIQAIDPFRKVAIAREMTKTFEECLRGTASELITLIASRQKLKGEVCILIEGAKEILEKIPLEETIELLCSYHGLSLKEAIKVAAKILKLPKSEVYKSVHELQ